MIEIRFADPKLARLFADEKRISREFGARNTRVIQTRLSRLGGFRNLRAAVMYRLGRFHPLKGNRKGQFALDLTGPMRLIFEPDHNPIPLLEDGSIDLTAVTKIIAVEVEDYH